MQSATGNINYWQSDKLGATFQTSQTIPLIPCNDQVFEDALDDVVEATEINISTLNNNKPAKSSSKSFKLKNKKQEKQRDGCQDVSLEQGLAEAQEAIDLFFNNQFDESREIAQRQLSV